MRKWNYTFKKKFNHKRLYSSLNFCGEKYGHLNERLRSSTSYNDVLCPTVTNLLFCFQLNIPHYNSANSYLSHNRLTKKKKPIAKYHLYYPSY